MLVLSWPEVFNMVGDLRRQIQKTNLKFDVIVVPQSGGWVPAKLLARELNIKTIINAIVDRRKVHANITGDVAGKDVLIVDDILDTGRTMCAICDRLRKMNVNTIRIAVLVFASSCRLLPDWYARTANNWAVFPWESEENALQEQKEKEVLR